MIIVALSLLYIALGAYLYSCGPCVVALCVLLYARFYYDRSENTGHRYSERIHAVVAHLTEVIAHHLFSYQITYDNEAEFRKLVTQRPVIFAAQPHGLFALASFFNVVRTDEAWASVRPLIHQYVFALPLLREVALALGARNVTAENIKEVLKTRSAYVVIDGVQGMLDASSAQPSNRYRRDRHEGLLDIAFESRTLVCPVVHRGQDQVFSCKWANELARVREFTMDLFGYPFPTIFTLKRAALCTHVLEPLDPRLFDCKEKFIEHYYEVVRRHTALDHIDREQAK